MSDNFKFTKSAIEWRRNTVLSKLAKGCSQSDIAKELQLHPSTISLDVQFLKEQAQQELQTHIQETIPLEYKKSKTGLDNLLKKATDMLENVTDPKTQIQTMVLLMDLYKSIIILSTDGAVIEQSMKKVQGLQSQQQQQTGNLAAEEKEKENDEEMVLIEPEEDLHEE